MLPHPPVVVVANLRPGGALPLPAFGHNSLQLRKEKLSESRRGMMATTTKTAAALPQLTNEDIARYSRHLILPEVGMEGQQKLKAAKVLCVGTGGLGSPLALYLAAAGIGTLGLVDFDVVDESNLQRQIIHSTPDVGRPKVDSAEQMLQGLNKNVNVIKHNT